MAFWREAEYPRDHKPGMRVPRGGSSCASCKFHKEEGNRCTNFYFKKWHGSDKIPAPADQFCSDWYESER